MVYAWRRQRASISVPKYGCRRKAGDGDGRDPWCDARSFGLAWALFAQFWRHRRAAIAWRRLASRRATTHEKSDHRRRIRQTHTRSNLESRQTRDVEVCRHVEVRYVSDMMKPSCSTHNPNHHRSSSSFVTAFAVASQWSSLLRSLCCSPSLYRCCVAVELLSPLSLLLTLSVS